MRPGRAGRCGLGAPPEATPAHPNLRSLETTDSGGGHREHHRAGLRRSTRTSSCSSCSARSDEVGATLNAALVVMGDKLGLYRALAGAGPLTPAELAERTGTAERYVREWLNAQAAGELRRATTRTAAGTPCRPSRRSRSPTRTARPTCPASSRSRSARCSTRRGSSRRPARGAGLRLARARDRRASTAVSGSSGPATTPTWSRPGCPRWTASWPSWSAGRSVADVGCGHGSSTILMAQAFPNSTFVGSDYHERLDRDRAAAGARAPGWRPGPLRDRPGRGLQRRRLRPGHDVRLPARHGRPGRAPRVTSAGRSSPTAPG